LQAAIRLIRDADVAVGNMEGSLADKLHFDGPLSGFVGAAEVAADLKQMGFDLVNRANNHLFDSEAAGAVRHQDPLRQPASDAAQRTGGPRVVPEFQFGT
jgi:poly-gamma-glutamate capsule biosynthesis protein CapA/YwtB (metallophosphatase superfamily)